MEENGCLPPQQRPNLPIVMRDSRPVVPNQWVQSFQGRTVGQQLLPASSSPPPSSPPLAPSMVVGHGVPEVAAESISMASTITTPTSSNSTSTHLTVEGRIGKTPKKRSRASRKGPTTLFNTDTTNFRAMVQQFTGAPTTPFSSGSQPGAAPLINFGLGGQGPYQQPMMLRPAQPQPSQLHLQLQQQLMALQGRGESVISLGSNRASSTNMGVSDPFLEGLSCYGQTSDDSNNGFRFVTDQERFRTHY